MERRYFYILISFISFMLCTCKKYDEGGFVHRSCKNLFGGKKVGSSKTWKLKKYEVNGIDSTYLINTGNIPDYYDKFTTFKLVGKKFCEYTASGFLYNHMGSIEFSYKRILIGNNNEAPILYSQCGVVNNLTYCARNILYPDQSDNVSEWKIVKLKSDELIITKENSKKYKIILQQ
jgi:hypothetical protein